MKLQTTNLDAWMQGVRGDVDTYLGAFFEQELANSGDLSGEAHHLVREVRDLTMRGGKRIRPIVSAAALVATCPGSDVSVTEVGAALELLQTYLLIHDDWMDQDDQRRGGPAVHSAFAQQYGDAHLGASLGILAGDLAATYAWSILLQAPFPTASRGAALETFVQIQKEVFAGQQLDLLAHVDVELMHDLKTGSYTVRGPARLGALLGEATRQQLAQLDAWSTPLGLGFQLRDDLLSTFGDPRTTGKPGDDLRHGKQNAVVALFEKDHPKSAGGPVWRVWGDTGASDVALEEALRAIDESGAKRIVEARIEELAEQSLAPLRGSQWSQQARTLLGEVAKRMIYRTG